MADIPTFNSLHDRRQILLHDSTDKSSISSSRNVSPTFGDADDAQFMDIPTFNNSLQDWRRITLHDGADKDNSCCLVKAPRNVSPTFGDADDAKLKGIPTFNSLQDCRPITLHDGTDTDTSCCLAKAQRNILPTVGDADDAKWSNRFLDKRLFFVMELPEWCRYHGKGGELTMIQYGKPFMGKFQHNVKVSLLQPRN